MKDPKIICSNGAKLIRKYPAVKESLEFLIQQKCEYYNDHPFKEKEKKIWVEQIKESIILLNQDYKEKGLIEKRKEKKESEEVFGRRGQIERFWRDQPFFYDESKIFWLWDDENKKWILSDEINFLNAIQEQLGIETIDSKSKSELISGFQQIGRKHKPEDMKKYWVQFKDKIYDLITGENFKATPKYFITNPIPWNVGTSEETPTIDKLFEQWVGKDYSQTLYEIVAYNLTLNKFMQRLIALCGGGSNGKGTFIKLNYRLLGKDNYVTSEIKTLSENVFEAAVLYRKLLCVMGEVSYGDLKNTNQLKKLGGEDLISFQFKGKMPFTDENTATCICATNSLPATPDKSIGFYRKWLIIDFPNQFKEIKKNLIESIPEKEFENLAFKCLNILKELYKTMKFTNEGDFDERMSRYEERSNPVIKFVEDFCEDSPGKNITIRDFTNSCNLYLKSKHLRVLSAIQVGKILRNEGFLVGNRKIDEVSSVVILNLSLNSKEKLFKRPKLSKRPLGSHVASILDYDSSNSSNSFKDKLNIIIERPGEKNKDFGQINTKDYEIEETEKQAEKDIREDKKLFGEEDKPNE